jgi:hypothetical protein
MDYQRIYNRDPTLKQYRRHFVLNAISFPTIQMAVISQLNFSRKVQTNLRYCGVMNALKILKDCQNPDSPSETKIPDISLLALAIPIFGQVSSTEFEYNVVNSVEKNKIVSYGGKEAYETQEVLEVVQYSLESFPVWQEETWLQNIGKQINLNFKLPPPPAPAAAVSAVEETKLLPAPPNTSLGGGGPHTPDSSSLLPTPTPAPLVPTPSLSSTSPPSSVSFQSASSAPLLPTPFSPCSTSATPVASPARSTLPSRPFVLPPSNASKSQIPSSSSSLSSTSSTTSSSETNKNTVSFSVFSYILPPIPPQIPKIENLMDSKARWEQILPSKADQSFFFILFLFFCFSLKMCSIIYCGNSVW